MINGIKIFVILFSVSVSAIGQITCRIIDQDTKKPIKDADVSVLDKNIETTTNFLGYFQINADTADYLIIRKPFYETGVVKVPSLKRVQIQITKRKRADYEGGLEQFAEFLIKNLRYPLKARRGGTEGRFYVSFTIDSLGQMSNIQTIRDIGSDCGSEVTELLKKVPNQWIPAETITTFILPLTFRLGESKIEPKEIELPQGVLLNELIVTSIGIERK